MLVASILDVSYSIVLDVSYSIDSLVVFKSRRLSPEALRSSLSSYYPPTIESGHDRSIWIKCLILEYMQRSAFSATAQQARSICFIRLFSAQKITIAG